MPRDAQCQRLASGDLVRDRDPEVPTILSIHLTHLSALNTLDVISFHLAFIEQTMLNQNVLPFGIGTLCRRQ